MVIAQCLKGRGLRNRKQRLQRVDKFFLRSMAINLLRGKANGTGQKGFKLARKNKVFSKETGRNRKKSSKYIGKSARKMYL